MVISLKLTQFLLAGHTMHSKLFLSCTEYQISLQNYFKDDGTQYKRVVLNGQYRVVFRLCINYFWFLVTSIPNIMFIINFAIVFPTWTRKSEYISISRSRKHLRKSLQSRSVSPVRPIPIYFSHLSGFLICPAYWGKPSWAKIYRKRGWQKYLGYNFHGDVQFY